MDSMSLKEFRKITNKIYEEERELKKQKVEADINQTPIECPKCGTILQRASGINCSSHPCQDAKCPNKECGAFYYLPYINKKSITMNSLNDKLDKIMDRLNDLYTQLE